MPLDEMTKLHEHKQANGKEDIASIRRDDINVTHFNGVITIEILVKLNENTLQ